MSENMLNVDDTCIVLEGRTLAETYNVVSNHYGQACNAGSAMKPFLKELNGKLGEMQGNADNMSAGDIENHEEVPTSVRDGHMVPRHSKLHPENHESSVEEEKQNLIDWMAEAGDSEDSQPEPEPEPEPETTEPEPEPESESDLQEIVKDAFNGVGDTNKAAVAEVFNNEPKVVEEILTHADSVSDFEVEEVDSLVAEFGDDEAKLEDAMEMRHELGWSDSKIVETLA